ncbi:MAG: penicillin-binding protein 2 [Bdellovibrionales bacterium]
MTRWRFSGSKQAPQPDIPGIFSPPKRHRLSTPREQALGLAKARLGVVFLIFSLTWVTIGGRLAYLTLSGVAEAPIVRAEPGENPISRADITDRHGTVLATSLPTVSLCADSKSIINPDDAAKQLLNVLPELNPKKLNEDLKSGKHCAIIRRHLTPRQYYGVNKLGIAGLDFLPDERRLYPVGNAVSHIVGFSDIDNNGLAGVEKAMDTRLSGNPEPLVLALDLRIQTVLRRELADAMNTYRAEAAIGLVMDVGTGEIIGMTSLPDFNPGRAGAASDEQLFNRNTLGVYEMGSTFKVFNTALALDTGIVRLSDTFDTVNPLKIGRHTIKDFEKEKHNLNVAEIFTKSSNIGSARMAQRMGGVKQRAFFERLGLTDKVRLEIPEVGAPLLPQASEWGEGTTATAAFGHGIAVNAVQLASAVATIVNDGHPVHPTLLKRDDSYEPDVDTVISPRTSAQIRGLMRLVVTHGTAKKADVDGYLVGGKTGTADKLDAKRQYVSNKRRSSFVGLFPINAPKYIVFAMLDDPKGNAKTKGFATAGWVVAPTVSNIITQIAPLLGIAPLPKDLYEATERQVLKPLGSDVVEKISASDEKDYAAVESDSVDDTDSADKADGDDKKNNNKDEDEEDDDD